jgi:glycine/D-amino acid oxidase-like deaminating enzyme
MSNREYDYLLVGQGIAGTCMAWHLIEAGKKVLIVDDPGRPSASQVAAGIFNPLTGRKLVKTWMADFLFPYALDFYSRLEVRLNAKLVHTCPIYRPYRSEEERKNYQRYSSNPDILKYIDQSVGKQQIIIGLNDPYGGLVVTGSGWVDLNMLIQTSRAVFMEKSQFVSSGFESSELIIKEQSVEWKEYKAGKIIFCQGVDARDDSLFGWLPFNPVKGQILDVTFNEYSASQIVNQGIFILPFPDQERYRVGATYSWHDLNWETSADGLQYLEAKLRPLVKGNYTLQAQRAGIRPSSKDRRPFVGLHPKYSHIGVFNGLGTKGVTLAPYFANEFVQYLEKGKELNPHVNIDRYFSLYYH